MEAMSIGPTGQGIGPNSNMLAALPEKLVKKVLNGVAANLTDSLSNHATQAVQQGVPWGHVMDDLLKFAPQSMGLKAGMSMMGSGGSPPGGPNGNGGGPPPGGQPPVGATKNDQAQVPQQDTTGTAPTVQDQATPQATDGNAILSQLLTAMQSQNGKKILPANGLFSKQGFDTNGNLQLGGMLDFQGANLKNLSAAQGLLGQQPMQIGDLQKIIAGVGGEQLSATTVPLNAGQRATKEYQDKEIAARSAEYQLNNAKEQMSALNQEQERTTAEFNAIMTNRSWIGKATDVGTAAATVAAYKNKLQDIGERMNKARENLVSLADNHPALKEKTLDSKELIGKTLGKYKLISIK